MGSTSSLDHDDKTIRIWNAETGSAVGKPLEGHTDTVWSVAYSPDGQHIISGSKDKTIRIWNAETGSAVGKPLEGRTGAVRSVAYSPDGQHIISGSYDIKIRIWNAETGSAVGKPLKGHTGAVWSVAYSPDGQHIISGSSDNTIRIWNAETDSTIGKPLEGHTRPLASIAYSPDAQHVIPGSSDPVIHLQYSFSQITSRFTSYIEAERPNQEGWVRDSGGGLLYWVPHDCRVGLHSPALLTIPLTSPIRSVSLQFDEFAFGTSWTQIFHTARP
jgi:WD40 repeat protein